MPCHLWRALRGACEGAVYLGLAGLLGAFVSGKSIVGPVPMALFMAALGSIIFALGRLISGQVLGAAIAGIAGLAIGANAGHRLVGDYMYTRPGTPRASPVSAGQPLEIAGPTLQGETFDLQRLRGKVVLVDFWATWCGPCVRELANVQRVYDRYHGDGFEVVGISADDSRDRLVQFVEAKKLPWSQIYFADDSGQRAQNPLMERYNVTSFPTTFLVDQQGLVAAYDVRGERLEQEVARLLGKPLPDTETGDVSAHSIEIVRVPIGLLLGCLLGVIIGATGGALLERKLFHGTPKAEKGADASPPTTGDK